MFFFNITQTEIFGENEMILSNSLFSNMSVILPQLSSMEAKFLVGICSVTWPVKAGIRGTLTGYLVPRARDPRPSGNHIPGEATLHQPVAVAGQQ